MLDHERHKKNLMMDLDERHIEKDPIDLEQCLDEVCNETFPRDLDVQRDLEVGGLSDFGVDGDIVDTDRIGVHRLGNSVAQSDNAPAALKVKDEMVPLIAKDAEEKYDKIHGQGAWKALPQGKKEVLTRVFKANCMRHLTNTFLTGGVKEEKATLKALYEKDKETRPVYLRDPSDLNAFMVTLSKGVSTGKDTYGKGFGEDFKSFNKNRKYTGLVCPMDRWDHGQRMDFSTKGGKIIYWMRVCIVFWLRMCIFSEPNILRDSMFITMTDTKNISGTFIRAVVDVKLTNRWTPLLCTTGINSANAAPVLQAIHRACKIPEDSFDGTLFEESFGVFEEFNTPGSMYAEWRESYKNKKGKTCDGRIIFINQVIDAEIFDPREVSNRSGEVREQRNALLSAWLKGMLHTIETGEAKRYLEGGDMANLTDETKEAFDGSWPTTNILEGSIGNLKYNGRRTDNSSMVTAGNLAVAQRNNMFGSPDAKYSRKRSRGAGINQKPQKRQREESIDISDSDVQSKSIEVLQAKLESSLIGKSTGQQFTILRKVLDRYVSGMQYIDLKPASYTSKKRGADENNTYLKASVINGYATNQSQGPWLYWTGFRAAKIDVS